MHLHGVGLRLRSIAAVDHGDYGLGEAEERLTSNGIDLCGSRFAGIATLTDALHQRDLSQQGHLHLLGQLLTALTAKDVVAVLR